MKNKRKIKENQEFLVFGVTDKQMAVCNFHRVFILSILILDNIFKNILFRFELYTDNLKFQFF